MTNPFFTKALQHWPHIIRVGKSKSRKSGDSSWKGLNASSLDFVQVRNIYLSKYKIFVDVHLVKLSYSLGSNK